MPASNLGKSFARRRLPPEESRKIALEAARQILINDGPQSVTLKSVAASIGRTHANLLHHFGSAAELQQALARHICDRMLENIRQSMVELNKGGDIDEAADRIARLTYDAFDKEGGAALAAWMALNGQPDAILPVLQTMSTILNEMKSEGRVVKEAGLDSVQIFLLAFGNAILGPQLSKTFNLPDDGIRNMSRDLIAERIRTVKAQ